MIQYNALSIISIHKELHPIHYYYWYQRKFPKWLQFLEKKTGWHHAESEIGFVGIEKPKNAMPFVRIQFFDGTVIFHHSDNKKEIDSVEDYVYKCIVHARGGQKAHGMFKYDEIDKKVLLWS